VLRTWEDMAQGAYPPNTGTGVASGLEGVRAVLLEDEREPAAGISSYSADLRPILYDRN
jgi:hypothetical protein